MHSWVTDCNNASVRICGLSWVDDAANSAVWQRRKLHTTKIRCLHLESEGGEHSLQRMADILPVDGSSALGTIAITKKAFDSV